MDYFVSRTLRGWRIETHAELVGQRTLIGTVESRKEAETIARLLAGWRGRVFVNGKHAFGRAA